MLKGLLPQTRKQTALRERPAHLLDMMEELWRRPWHGLDRFPFEFEEFPPLDIREDDKEVSVKVELPGLSPDDIEVNITQGQLTIKGEKKFEDEEKKDNYHRIERIYGHFQRSVTLPSGVDETKVAAKFKDGILCLTMPKTEGSKSTRIKIES